MAAVVDGDLPRIRRGGATSEEIERKRNSDEEVRPTPQMPTHLRTQLRTLSFSRKFL